MDFIERTLATGKEEIPWPVMAQILILARLCNPSSELHIAEHVYESSALSDLLGVPAEKVTRITLRGRLPSISFSRSWAWSSSLFYQERQTLEGEKR